MSTLRRSACTCGPWPTPPKMTAHLLEHVDAVVGEARRRSAVASSRVGVSTSARGPAARRGAAARARRSQDGQRERRRLAGAGLRAAEHVAAGEQVRNRLRLDRRRRCVARVGDRAQEGIDQAERRERRDGGWRVREVVTTTVSHGKRCHERVSLSTGGFSVAPPSTGDGADEARGLLVGWLSLRKPFRQRRRQPVPGAPRDERGGRTNSCDGVPCATRVEKSSTTPG